MIRAVVFDLDGTLIDSDRDIAEAVNAALSALGRDRRPLTDIRRMIGHGARQLLASALDSGDDGLVERARAVFMDHYAAHPADHTVAYDGIRELLAALEGRIVAVATNKPARITRLVLEHLGLPLAAASADEVPARKPDPAVLRLALERATPPGQGAVRPDQVVYVGDMDVDVKTARAFGARAIGVGWGFAPNGARAAAPDAWATHPRDIASIIDAWDRLDGSTGRGNTE